MLNFIKSHKILSLIIVLVIFVLGVIVLIPKKQKPSTIPAYNSTIPGTTTKDQVISKLGKPLEEKQNGSGELLTFDSGKTIRPDEYYFQNDVNELVKEIIPYNDNRKIDDIRKIYGNANLVLYGEGSVGGFYLFVYLDKGVAYIGNPNSGNLLEVWYFTPVSESVFISKFASNYSKTQPTPGEERSDF